MVHTRHWFYPMSNPVHGTAEGWASARIRVPGFMKESDAVPGWKWTTLLAAVCAFVWLVLSAGPWVGETYGAERVVRQDADGDGRIDRVAHLDASGNVILLEVDIDGDEFFETRQVYEKSVLVRIEKDTDRNGKPDETHFFENGKRSRQEKTGSKGRITDVVLFDQEERPLRWERDTTGDGRMDTISEYREGKIQRITRDTTGDGRVNIWQDFQNEQPKEQRTDHDGDGRLDQVVIYDSQGQPEKSLHDLDGDGRMETVRFYRKGELVRQEVDEDGVPPPGRIVEYSGGQPVLDRQDTNGDGRYDAELKFKEGKPAYREEDSDHDGKMDRFTEFDAAGRPLVVREEGRTTRFLKGEILSVEETGKGRTVFTEYEGGQPARQTVDEDGNGRPEQTIHFDREGRIARAERDTNLDGRPDTWERYQTGVLIRTEQDRNHDGKIDAETVYVKGNRSRISLDTDHDGRFETTQRFDHPEWSMVTEVDRDGDGQPEERYAYSKDVLRLKTLFEKAADRPVFEEAYDEQGRVVWSREALSGGTGATLTWRFDEDEKAVEAQKDSDGDGRTDVWFHYSPEGRVERVAEDRNRDGKADLWEEYDASEAVVSRSEDLDFDGVADIEKDF